MEARKNSLLSEADAKRLLSSEQLMRGVRVAHVLCISKLAAPVATSTISKIWHDFKYNEHDDLLQKSLSSFIRLHTLVISGSCLKPLSFLFNGPASLKNFGFVIHQKGRGFKKTLYQQAARFLAILAEKGPFRFQLEGLKIASDEPISQSSIHPIFVSRRAMRAEDFYNAYFGSRRVLKFEKFRLETRKGLITFGLALYKVLDSFRETLTLIETEQVDMALVFNAHLMQKINENHALSSSQFHLHGFESYNYCFPRLKMMSLDNASYSRIDAWVEFLQQSNLDVREKHHLVLALHYSIGRLLMVKLVKRKVVLEAQREEESGGGNEGESGNENGSVIPWYYLTHTDEMLRGMKRNLGVWSTG